MPKAKEDNIYDLVERASLRTVPRLELWEQVLQAIIEKRLRPLSLDLSERPNPVAAPAETYSSWLTNIYRSVAARRFDPNNLAHVFKKIIVRNSDFESFLRKGNMRGRGPMLNATGYQEADRRLFPQIKRLIKHGEARSAHGAALILLKRTKGASKSSSSAESAAKRISALYRKERP